MSASRSIAEMDQVSANLSKQDPGHPVMPGRFANPRDKVTRRGDRERAHKKARIVRLRARLFLPAATAAAAEAEGYTRSAAVVAVRTRVSVRARGVIVMAPVVRPVMAVVPVVMTTPMIMPAPVPAVLRADVVEDCVAIRMRGIRRMFSTSPHCRRRSGGTSHQRGGANGEYDS